MFFHIVQVFRLGVILVCVCVCFRVKDLINYSSEELVGKSLYDYHHALDSEAVENAYKDCKLGKNACLVM